MSNEGRQLPPRSRYAPIEQVEAERPDGRRIVYLRRRFVPRPETLPTVAHHRLADGERIDHVAAAEIGDPTAWWQVADANGVTDPEDLVRQPDAVLRISFPQGVTGA